MHGDHELDPVRICRRCGTDAATPASVRVNSPGWDIHGPSTAGD
jgi:hypothetical protein